MNKKTLVVLTLGFGIFFTQLACNEQSNTQVENKLTGDARVDAATIVEQATKAMQTALKKSIGEGDLVNGLNYCNVQAYPITDSIAKYYGVQLKRTSLRVRNIANEPDSTELVILRNLQKTAFAGVTPSPMILDIDQEYYRYVHPIMIQPMCLNCHGLKERGDIALATQKAIDERYPLDKAYDYTLNDFRGIWTVLLPKNIENQPVN